MASEYNDPSTTTTLPSPPFDSISSIRFHPTNPDLLLVSSWDTTVRYYDSGSAAAPSRPAELKAKFDHRAAVLACAFNGDGSRAYSGGLDTGVRELDLSTEKITHLGTHADSVSAMVFAPHVSALVSGSWDRSVRFWDGRAPSGSAETSKTDTPERVYALDVVQNTLVVAMASRLFHIYDVRNMRVPSQQRESSLKYMTRSLACMPTGEGYATASVEGRIAVEWFDVRDEVQEKKYAFKCHRQTVGSVDHVWPVNALAFHPVYNTFASAGSDGTVSIWDHKVKKRLRQYPKFPTAVSALAFNCTGTQLAIASSYTWDEGEAGARVQPGGVPWVGVRRCGEEVRPKGWSG
ncbi:WD40 repeat-like protein [Coprinellus micaceus]|uniref:WD40 repeat-like protein n=1 Tax=Coprinellus micaceus TaxID=71717 RepID=A0A4Y7SHT4_COPMI|nr:WD40 repeat-like protein [Coprinellus micaceus]